MKTSREAAASTDSAAEPRLRRMTAPRLWNPFVRTILRSPAHGLLSPWLLLVTLTGRKTSRVHTFPVGYVEEGAQIYVLAAEYETKSWWRNFEGGSPAQLRVRGRTIEVEGEALRWDRDPQDVVKAFGAYVAQRPRVGRMLGVTRIDSIDQIRAAAKKVVMVRLRRIVSSDEDSSRSSGLREQKQLREAPVEETWMSGH